MLALLRPASYRRIVPEVIQTSAMDCGPASLASLLHGFGIPAGYGRLREACQTDVDGTSIDTIEQVAVQLGLDAEQVMVPVDHVLLPEAAVLPALAVVALPNNNTHFVVIWRAHGRLVQVMDPATGRHWLAARRLLQQLYRHTHAVPTNDWRAWAASDDFLAPLQRRLLALGCPPATIAQLVEAACANSGWQSLAALDAATRMVAAVVRSGGLKRGTPAARVVASLFERASQSTTIDQSPIPASDWMVRPNPADADELLLRGAVLLRVRGRLMEDKRPTTDDQRPTTAEQDVASVGGTIPSVDAPIAWVDAPTASVGGTIPSVDAPTAWVDGSQEHVGTDPSSVDRPPSTVDTLAPNPLSPELAAALAEPVSRPLQDVARALNGTHLVTLLAFSAALLLAAAGAVFEALLFRGLLGLSQVASSQSQQLLAVAGLLVFVAALLLLDLPLAAGVLRLGRQLETQLRLRFLAKIPRLHDRYFQSRLTSDMAERSHSIHLVRQLPDVARQFLRVAAELLITAGALIWLDPASAPAALLLVVVAIGLPLAAQWLLTERDLRVRSHAGGLSRFYFDALNGLTAIRAHHAERAVRRAHDELSAEWQRAGLRLQTAVVGMHGLQGLIGLGLALWLVAGYLARPASADLLLVVYWTLSLPLLGQELALLAQQYPIYRNTTMRLVEPLGAPEAEQTADEGRRTKDEGRRTGDGEPHVTLSVAKGLKPIDSKILRCAQDDNQSGLRDYLPGQPHGVAITLRDVSVQAAGHTILHGIDLDLAPGSQVAVVGPSGAGKSTLVGLLLGWHRPASGELLVDGLPLNGAQLAALRRETAWVDPAVQLWNRAFLDNLRYGADHEASAVLDQVLSQADLRGVLERLPAGLQTQLGEGGALVSGGEGQRVRFGRSLLRSDARLVILDEPFRGLDRQQRHSLLVRARSHWQGATLLCVTHDVAETLAFDRVLVVDAGQICEDGHPAELAACADSRYRALLDAEAEIQQHLWAGPAWRHLRVDAGKLHELQPSVPAIRE